MPSDLLELTRQLQGGSLRGAALGDMWQDSYRKGMEREQMRREMEAQQQLRELFAQGQQPTLGQIGAVNPELALKYPTFGLDLEYKKSQIGKNLADIDAKTFEAHKNRVTGQANMIMPIIDARDMAIQRGESPEVANKRAMAEIGAKAPVLESMGIGFLPGFSITDNMTPDDIRAVFNMFGVKSQLQQMQELQNQETAKLQGQLNVPPRMTADQFYGGYRRMPDGSLMLDPGMGGGGGGGGGGGQMPTQRRTGMENLTDKDLARLANTGLPEEKQNAIAELNKRAPGGEVPTIYERPDSGVVTPDEYQQLQIKREAEKAAAVERAKAEEQDRQQMKKTVNQYKTLRSPVQIEKIIESSKTGNLDDALRDIGKLVGVGTEKGTATAKLKTIVQQFAKLSPFAPGSQSDKEYQARLDEIGAIDSSTPVNERLGQFGEFIRSLKENMIQRGEFTPAELVEMVSKGQFTADEAARIADRLDEKLFTGQGAAQ